MNIHARTPENTPKEQGKSVTLAKIDQPTIASVLDGPPPDTPMPATVLPVEAIEQSAAACLAWLPADSLERLARYVAPYAIRQRRLEERDQAVRALAQAYGSLSSGRAIAAAIRRALTIYAGGAASRHNVPPADAQRAAIHRILQLSDRRVPSAATLRRALAGLDQ